MKSERPAARLSICRIREQGIARRGANALPYAVAEPDEKHLRCALRYRGERTHKGRNSISDHDEWLSLSNFVRPPAAHELENRRR